MTRIADYSNMADWPTWVWALIGAGISASFVLLAAAVILARAADRPAPKNAPPAPALTQVPAGAKPLTRDQQLCVQHGHVCPDWARTPTHLICARCGQSWERVPEEDWDCHVEQALDVANSKPKPDPDDELALADLALWEIENDWATP